MEDFVDGGNNNPTQLLPAQPGEWCVDCTHVHYDEICGTLVKLS